MIECAAVADPQSGGLTLFLVNRDQEADVALDGDLRQYRGLQVTEHIVLSHDDPKATNTMEDPRRVFPRDGGGAEMDGDGRLSARLPKLSWNVIRLGAVS